MKTDGVRRAGQRVADAADALRKAFDDFETVLAEAGARWSDAGVPRELLERARTFSNRPTSAERVRRESDRKTTGGEAGSRHERDLISEMLRSPSSIVPPPAAPREPWTSRGGDRQRVVEPAAAARAPKFPAGPVGPR